MLESEIVRLKSNFASLLFLMTVDELYQSKQQNAKAKEALEDVSVRMAQVFKEKISLEGRVKELQEQLAKSQEGMHFWTLL